MDDGRVISIHRETDRHSNAFYTELFFNYTRIMNQ